MTHTIRSSPWDRVVKTSGGFGVLPPTPEQSDADEIARDLWRNAILSNPAIMAEEDLHQRRCHCEHFTGQTEDGCKTCGLPV